MTGGSLVSRGSFNHMGSVSSGLGGFGSMSTLSKGTVGPGVSARASVRSWSKEKNNLSILNPAKPLTKQKAGDLVKFNKMTGEERKSASSSGIVSKIRGGPPATGKLDILDVIEEDRDEDNELPLITFDTLRKKDLTKEELEVIERVGKQKALEVEN
jgi:hypothetical protein